MIKNMKHERRYRLTLDFLKESIPDNSRILDLGVPNDFSRLMTEAGYKVSNTGGEDLDLDYHAVKNKNIDAVTAFEIFEHMFAPFNILREIECNKLIASVPLKLWFASAYWNMTDERDRHYHEFEVKQFNWLLEKTGWKVIRAAKWTSPANTLGIRPFLRRFTPRFYIVYCERV